MSPTKEREHQAMDTQIGLSRALSFVSTVIQMTTLLLYEFDCNGI